MKIIFVLALFGIMFLIINCGDNMNNKADLVLLNGKIATVVDENAVVEALAVKEGKIFAVGSNDEIKKLIGNDTKEIDLNGNFAMPGFIESHAHFIGLGESLLNLDLRSAKNWNEVVAIVEEAVKKSEPGQWILGRGWHQEKFDPKPNPDVNGYPVHDLLSKVSPNNPVLLGHASGHAVFANAKAMEIAGVNKNTPNPSGGTIVKDKNGNPIGVFEENGELLVTKAHTEYLSKRNPQQLYNDYEKRIKLAAEDCLKKGITSCADAGQPFDVVDIYKKLEKEDKLPVRINVMVQDSYENMQKKLPLYRTDNSKGFLNIRSIKQYIDGALGSRGAWMLEPYDDLKSHTGSNVTSIKELKDISELAITYGYQMRIHAIGDRGNREVLNIYEEKFKQHHNPQDLRWCIEHVQHLSTQDISRLAFLGVIAAMQPVHCTSDALFVPERIGNKRAKEGAYVWRKLIDSGALICSGTDAPVEDINPIECFYSAVTRKSKDGSVFYPDQKMTRMEALKSYTTNCAFASFEENIKGKLIKGMMADITVLSNDLLNCADDEIPNTKVLYTIVNGKIVYEQK